MTTFLNKYKACILGMYAFFILLHFVLKDNFFPISILFYAAPLILIIALGFVLAWIYRKNKLSVFGMLALSFVFLFHWFNNYYALAEENLEAQHTSSILFWNVAKKPELQLDIIINEIEKSSTSIITLVETRYLKDKEVQFLNDKFPGYTFKRLEDEMLIGVKGRIDSVYNKYEEGSYKFNYIIASINNIETKILIADVYANPFKNKEKPLSEILSFAEANTVDIIVGDFNTPFESVNFKDYNLQFTSFHHYSNGFTATWPYGIPLLELDQIWLNKKHQPIALKKEQYLKSDHKLLIAEYGLISHCEEVR